MMEKTPQEEVRDVCLNFFKEITKDDPFSEKYLEEKVNRINAFYDDDDAWVAFRMLHMVARRAIFSTLSDNAKNYLLENDFETVYYDNCGTSNGA